jgi:hypothetical protein
MKALFHSTVDDLYTSQSKLWGSEGVLDRLYPILETKEQEPRIKKLLYDIVLLRHELNPPSAKALAGRITLKFKVDILTQIDRIRHQLKILRFETKRNYGLYRDYDPSLKRLKSVRKHVHKVPLSKDPDPFDRLPHLHRAAEGAWSKSDPGIAVFFDQGTQCRDDIDDEYAFVKPLFHRDKAAEETLDFFMYRRERKKRQRKKIGLTALGVGTAIVGLAVTVGGAVAVTFTAGALAPVLGVGIAIAIASASEVALIAGPTVGVFGASGALYERFRMDPAMKKFVRRHYPDQLSPGDYLVSTRKRHLDFAERYEMIQAWAKDFHIDIDREEFIWFACKDNFARFLEIRQLIATKEDRKLLARMMRMERKDLLWAAIIDGAREAEAD